jgi:hypothetical protein
MGICYILPPRMGSTLRLIDAPPGSDPSCLLASANHPEEHVFRLSDGRYFAWKDDWECDCCKPEEDDRCYVIWELTAEELRKYKGALE